MKTADRIINELFTNGVRDKAKRLMLVLEDGSDGGGWGKFAVKNIIEKAITEHDKEIIKLSIQAYNDGFTDGYNRYHEILHKKELEEKWKNTRLIGSSETHHLN